MTLTAGYEEHQYEIARGGATTVQRAGSAFDRDANRFCHIDGASAQSLFVDQDKVDLNPLRKLDEELGIAVEMVHLRGVAPSECGHGLFVGPVGDDHEPA